MTHSFPLELRGLDVKIVILGLPDEWIVVDPDTGEQLKNLQAALTQNEIELIDEFCFALMARVLH